MIPKTWGHLAPNDNNAKQQNAEARSQDEQFVTLTSCLSTWHRVDHLASWRLGFRILQMGTVSPTSQESCRAEWVSDIKSSGSGSALSWCSVRPRAAREPTNFHSNIVRKHSTASQANTRRVKEWYFVLFFLFFSKLKVVLNLKEASLIRLHVFAILSSAICLPTF